LTNLQPESSNQDNPIEKKVEINYESKFSINPILKDEIEK
jgi:hypothetical protein